MQEFSKELSSHYILFFYNKIESQNRSYVLLQILSNLEDPYPWYHLNHSCDYFKNKPLVLVGAGSSLDPFLPYLKEKAPDINIMAIGSAMGVLFDHEIACDMGVMVCPNQTAFERLEKKVEASVIFTTLRCQSQLFLDCKNMKVILPQTSLNSFNHLSSQLGECPVLKSLPIMASTSLSIALGVAQYLGFSPIILAGIDLGYGDKKYAHNLESDWEEERFLPEKKVLEQMVKSSATPIYRLGSSSVVEGIRALNLEDLEKLDLKWDKITQNQLEACFSKQVFNKKDYLLKIKQSFKSCQDKWDLPLREVHLEEEIAYKEFLHGYDSIEELDSLQFSSERFDA
jgi:hypothetical protein